VEFLFSRLVGLFELIMKRKNFCSLPLLLAVALGSAVAFPAKGQDTNAAPGTNALTLDAAIRLSLADNPEIRMLAAGIASARGEVTTAKTWQNPEISVAPGFKSVRDPSDTLFHGNFGLEQAFEWPGKQALRRAVAEKNVTVRQIALGGFRSQLAIQVRRAYLTVLAAREVITLRERRLTLAKSFVDAAKKKVEGGFAPEFEATKAEVEVVAAQKLLREAQARHAAARVALNALMGRKPTEPLTVTGALDGSIQLPTQSTLLEQALARNPVVKVQEAEAERTGLSLQSIRKSRLPDFKVGPSVEYTRDEQIVGLGVSLPLPFWDKKKGEIATATAEQEKALAELDKLRREILRDVATAAQNLTAAKESLAFYTPALRDKLKAALDAAAQSYSEGRTPLLLYLESQRTYFDTQTDYFETLQKLFETQAELESALGIPLNQLSQSANEIK
jgi:outer membrane protein, heavy metal efflux system